MKTINQLDYESKQRHVEAGLMCLPLIILFSLFVSYLFVHYAGNDIRGEGAEQQILSARNYKPSQTLLGANTYLLPNN